MKALDLIGHEYYRWSVVDRVSNGKNGHSRWLCKCKCGTIREVDGTSLRSGMSKSCGCYEKDHPSNLKHGGRRTRLYNVWCHIKTRCYNPKWHAYFRYGGRGIKVCKGWVNDFSKFREWSLSNGYRKDLQIDRKDNDGPYSPENCQWVTAFENKSKNAKISNKDVLRIREKYTGRYGEIVSMAREFNVTPSCIQKITSRINRATL